MDKGEAVLGGVWGAIVAAYILFVAHNLLNPVQPKARAASYSALSRSDSQDSTEKSFNGDECLSDCSGHEAGFKWAQDHHIHDEEICERAGDHSDSPSFAEGCSAFVRGDNDDVKDDAVDSDER